MKSLDIRSEPAVRLLSEFLDMDADPGHERANAEHFAHGASICHHYYRTSIVCVGVHLRTRATRDVRRRVECRIIRFRALRLIVYTAKNTVQRPELATADLERLYLPPAGVFTPSTRAASSGGLPFCSLFSRSRWPPS